MGENTIDLCNCPQILTNNQELNTADDIKGAYDRQLWNLIYTLANNIVVWDQWDGSERWLSK